MVGHAAIHVCVEADARLHLWAWRPLWHIFFNSCRQHDGTRHVLLLCAGPNTNSSQFFITYRAQAHLNGESLCIALHRQLLPFLRCTDSCCSGPASLANLSLVLGTSAADHHAAPAPRITAGKYTVFGQVIDGMEVLDKMEKVSGRRDPSYSGSAIVSAAWGRCCNALVLLLVAPLS